VDIPLAHVHIIPIPRQPVFALTPKYLKIKHRYYDTLPPIEHNNYPHIT